MMEKKEIMVKWSLAKYKRHIEEQSKQKTWKKMAAKESSIVKANGEAIVVTAFLSLSSYFKICFSSCYVSWDGKEKAIQEKRSSAPLKF